MHLVPCTSAHLPASREILNEAIVHTTALWDYEPRTPAMVETWFRARQQAGFPVIGALDGDGTLMGFTTYGTFRERPAYKYSVEHSVYVASPFRRQGLGRQLLREIITVAQAHDVHVMVGGIASENTVSIALHRKFGFTLAGTVRQAGFKFGRWLDLELWQLILPTPARPVDGNP